MQISPEKIKHFRKENGWSQDVLAKASGLSLRTIQRIEKDGNASTETQLSLAAALNKSPQELVLISPTIEVKWKWRSMMQGILALLVVFGAIVMLLVLGGDISIFTDYYSALFILLFMYAATVIAFGGHGLIKSIIGLKYLFTNEIKTSEATKFLSKILKKQIYFIYGGALVGLLTGIISIYSNIAHIKNDAELHAAYAVNLLVLLYAAILAEGILRPLAAKLAIPTISKQNSH